MGLLSTIGAVSGRAFGLTRLSAAIKDAYFNLTTLLLPGNGTNGAQNNTFLDSSSNNFSITRNGNTTQGTFTPFSQTGWGNYFDGSSYLLNSSPTSVIAPGTSNFTAEFWVYATTDQQSQAYGSVLHIGSSAAGAWAVSLLYSSSGAMKLRFNTSTTDYDSTSTIATNQWYHIAVVRSGTSTNQTTIYVNGSSFYTFTLSDNLSNSSGIYVGTTAFNTTARRLNGYVSNLRLTIGGALYTGSFTPSTIPLTTTVSSGTVQLLTCQSNRFIDNSTNAFAITANGTPSVQAFSPFAPTAAYSASTVGGSGYFDGSGDYLTVADNAALDLGTSDFCIDGWAYLESTSEETFVAKWGAVANSSSYLLYVSSGVLYFITTTNGLNTDVQLTGSSVTTGTWLHFAAVRSGSSYALFQNGTRVATATNSNTIYDSSTVVSLGRYTGGGLGQLNGYLSNIRIVKGSSVYSPSSSTITVPTAPTTAVTNTQLLCDFTNAGITDATAKNDLETVGNAQISTTQSKFGGSSMYFDGTGDYLLVGNSSTSPLYKFNDFTIEFWMYLSGGSGTRRDIVHYDGGGTNGLGVFVNTTNVLWAGVNNNYNASSSTPSLNTWYHVAFVRNGSGTNNCKLYVDGTQVLQFTQTGTVSPGVNMYIGRISSGDPGLIGYLDDFRISQFARYTTAFTPPTSAFPVQ